MATRPSTRLPPVNHKQIEAFRAVMITGTTTAAAVLLHTSQPVISKLIARLQSTSGVKLFELRKSRLVPTPEARVLLKTVERSYLGLEQISHALEELRGTHTGTLRIGSLPSFGMGLLPLITSRFMAQYPGVSVVVETLNSDLIKQSIVTGRLDIGVVHRHTDVAGVHTNALPVIRNVCVMHRSHRLAGEKLIDVSALHNEDFIAPSRDSATRSATDSFLHAHGVTPNIVAETTYAITICALARQRVGVGLVSPHLATLMSDSDVVVRPLKQPMTVELLLITPMDSSTSMTSEKFIEMLRQAILDYPDPV